MLFHKIVALATVSATSAMATTINDGAPLVNTTAQSVANVSTGVLDYHEGANVWARFCDDEDCTENCGIAVQLSNPGCLTEYGRKSIKFHGAYEYGFYMVASPDSTCGCQGHCRDAGISGDCQKINHESKFNSFRFIEGGCDDDNC